MKHFKHFLAIALPVLTLGVPAYAGIMDTPGYVPPPPPPPAAAPAPDDMRTPAVAPGDIDTPTLAEFAIESILGALAFF